MELFKRKDLKLKDVYLDKLNGNFTKDVAKEKFENDLFIKLFNEKITRDERNNILLSYEGKGKLDLLHNVERYLYHNNIDIKSFGVPLVIADENDDSRTKEAEKSFYSIDFSPFNEVELEEIFEDSIEAFYKNKKQETLSNRSLNRLIASLLKDKQIKSLYDPAIGTGNLLLQIGKYHKEARIFGQDISENMIKLCKMNLLIHGKIDDVKNVYEGHTIINPKHIEGGRLKRFDCIVSNPPLVLKSWGYDEMAKGDYFNRFYRGLPNKMRGEYAFITHIVESLNDNGIGVIVVPGGVLFRSSVDGQIRKKLIEENIIEGIINLPNNMLYGTGIAVNLLIINKNKENNSVLFIDASSEIATQKRENTLSNESIEKIVNTYNNKLSIEGFSLEVSNDYIAEKNYTLSVQDYVESLKNVTKCEELDINEIMRRIKESDSKIREIECGFEEVLERQIELNRRKNRGQY